MARIMQLTREQEARFPEFVAKWTAIGLSTKPADRERAEAAIAGLYRLAKLREPRVIWLPCPLSAALAATAYAAVMNTRGAVDGAVSDAVRGAVEDAVYDAVRSAVDDAVDGAVRGAVDDAVDGAVYGAVRSAVRGAVGGAVDDAVGGAIGGAVRGAVYGAVDDAVRDAVGGAVRGAVDDAVGGAIGGATRSAGRAFWAGSLWAGYAAWADYFVQVLAVAIDRNYLDLVESCGCYWVLNDVCFASERPRVINLDERGRLHSETGQSIGYPSGWGLYHWHGVAVSRDIVERPETITVAAIDAQRNAEVRRVMLERFGFERFIRDGRAKRIDHDERWGTLYRRQLAGDEDLVMIEVVNRSPEPDGSFRHYMLRVHPECRPMSEGGLGSPQPLTALNAVASTFGMAGADYARQLGAES